MSPAGINEGLGLGRTGHATENQCALVAVRPQDRHFAGMWVRCTRIAQAVVSVVPHADQSEVGNRREHCAPGDRKKHTSELQSLMRISYAVFCLKKKKKKKHTQHNYTTSQH